MRHGAPLPGHLEGEPGRAPQVHHQGADRALAALFAGLLGFLLAACGTEEAKRVAPAPTKPTREGLIAYQDPVPPQGTLNPRRSEFQPEIQAFATAEADLVREHPEEHVLSGPVRGSGGTTAIAQRLFKSQVRGGSVRLITQEKFSDLWRRLEASGLFTIPAYRGKEPPKDESYFLLRSGKQQWIFTRPNIQQLDANAPGMESLQCWIRSKRVLVDFTNEL